MWCHVLSHNSDQSIYGNKNIITFAIQWCQQLSRTRIYSEWYSEWYSEFWSQRIKHKLYYIAFQLL
jgi:hypothetical protein